MKKKGSTGLLVFTTMLFAVAMTLAGLAVYIKAGDWVIVKNSDYERAISPDNEVRKFTEIDGWIQDTYLGEYDREEQMDDVYRAMVDSLGDKYTRYLDKEELEQLKQGINGSYTGTGIVSVVEREDKEGFLIADIIEGGPADSVGIKAGDIILEVNGETKEDVDSLADSLRGDPGTKVNILILRDNEEKEYSLIRGDIKGSSIESKTLEKENIGYIRIRTFGEDTSSQFNSSLSAFEKAQVDGIIIDLRDNPGGLFGEGIKVADRLLPEGMIVYTVNKEGEKENFNSDAKKTNLPMVVLINENTASTSELLAAAIKAGGAGKLVGAKTFGKGVIQETHIFSDNTAVNITVSEFFTSDGNKINGKGVTPDKTIKKGSKEGEDLQLEGAIQILKDTV